MSPYGKEVITQEIRNRWDGANPLVGRGEVKKKKSVILSFIFL